MIWICPYCGYENDSDRIGRKEPNCVRCHRTRIDPDDLEAESKFTCRQLERDIETARGRLSDTRDEIASLECDLSELKSEYKEIFEELKELRAEQEKIPKIIYRERVRCCPEITKDQQRLFA